MHPGSNGLPIRYRILIPARNEQEHIGEVVKRSLRWNPKVLVVCDSCTDRTAAEAAAAGAEILIPKGQGGKGYSLRFGWNHLLKKKDWDHLIILDGDGQHTPEDIPRFLCKAEHSGADLIIGSRAPFLPPMPTLRRATNRIMSYIISRIVHHSVRDSQCGFRLLSRKFIEQVNWTSHSFEIETEMILKAKSQNIPFTDVPIRTLYASETSSIRPGIDTWKWIYSLLTFHGS